MKKFFRVLILCFILPLNILFSQLTDNELRKIDPSLHSLLKEQIDEKITKESIFLTTIEIESITSKNAFGESVYGLIVHTKNPMSLISEGIIINSLYDNIITARVTKDQIVKLAQNSDVIFISPGEVFYTTNDVAGGLIGSDLIHNGYINETSYEGAGVIVCIIDTGIDWEHLDFRDPANDAISRILYIWDQTLTAIGGETTPAARGGDFSTLNYGVEYSKAQIEDEIDGSPAGFVRQEDTNGHGTHVAGSAAGNGAALSTRKYAGIAPKADILVIKSGNGTFSNSNLIDALTYAKAVADDENKPIVVNMSLGGHSNAHDGTSAIEQAVDTFVDNGRIAVISAGNDGSNNIHINGTLPASGTTDINFSVPSYSPTPGTDNDFFYFKVWLDNNTDVTANVTSPNAVTYSRNAGESGTGGDDSDGAIYLENLVDVNNSDRYILLIVDDNDASKTPAVGTWTLQIQNNTGSSVDYHGWLYSTSISTSLIGGNSNYTVGSPGTANEAITIGSYVSRWRWNSSDGGFYSYSGTDYSDDISSFSSIGPTRDSRQKPDLTGPGQAIVSSLSSHIASPTASSIVPGDKHIRNQGTSMSAPVVAGAVALLLEQNNSLSGSTVKSLLTSNTDTDTYTGGGLPDYTWGYGKVNIFKALAKSINSSWIPNQEILAYDEWTGNSFASLSAGEYAAVRYSPSISGSVTGAFFHPHDVSNITSDISFEIWSDNSGMPDSKMGSTVTFDKDNLLLFSWNYINLVGTGVSITSGTDYHLVMYYPTGTELRILMDASSSDGRSSGNLGGGWGSYVSNDFRMRMIVSEESSALPVELVAFSAELIDNKVRLEWETAMEINNYGFDIERRIVDATNQNDWNKIGFVLGNGTSASSKYYEFIDEFPPAEFLEYRLKQIDSDGSYEYYTLTAKVDASTITGIAENIPNEFALHQNYPNPFNPSTTIKFDLPEKSNVSIVIYNVLGQTISTLLNEELNAGYHEVKFSAENLSSNIYFYRIKTDNNVAVKKMMVIK